MSMRGAWFMGMKGAGSWGWKNRNIFTHFSPLLRLTCRGECCGRAHRHP